MDQILRRAEERTERAFEVIEALDLIGRWSRCGRPSLVGSVSFGLVVNRDIDLDIISKQPTIEQGFGVISEIAVLQGVLKIRYSNCLEKVDQGLRWQIEYRDKYGDIWTVDNWLLCENHPHAGLLGALVERMQKALSPELRRVILQIKETVQSEPKARGIDIYEAVISHGVRSPQEFAIWLEGGERSEISEWLPHVESQPE